MVLLVNHGYRESDVLILDVEQLNSLGESVLRVRREALAEYARATFVAAQGTAKGLEEWLGKLLRRETKKSSDLSAFLRGIGIKIPQKSGTVPMRRK